MSSPGNNQSNNSNNNSNSTSTHAQIVQNLFAKAAHIVVCARTSTSANNNNNTNVNENDNSLRKSNKWFNIETPDSDSLRAELKFWKAMFAPPANAAAKHQQQLLPLIIDIYLDISGISSKQRLALRDDASMRRHPIPADALVGYSVDPITCSQFAVKKKRILLESWQLTLL
ncbi:autophagy protein 13 [Entophlyctis luteolus]|nr:autophagy protein 13 [Entophlyctis luteolus]